MRYVLILWLLTGAALAQTPLSGAEFDAYTKGRTLTYLKDGEPYGIEIYRPGRSVTWTFIGDECRDGRWYEPEPGLICFLYEGVSDSPQCWNFFRTDNGLQAFFANEPESGATYEAHPSSHPLICLGPKVGV